jgi:hypothetical protein
LDFLVSGHCRILYLSRGDHKNDLPDQITHNVSILEQRDFSPTTLLIFLFLDLSSLYRLFFIITVAS